MAPYSWLVGQGDLILKVFPLCTYHCQQPAMELAGIVTVSIPGGNWIGIKAQGDWA